MTTLKDFIESREKEFNEKLHIYGKTQGIPAISISDIFLIVTELLQQQTTQAYELGKQETLAMVMREIEEINILPEFEPNDIHESGKLVGKIDTLSTLKQKLLTNIK